MGEPLSRLKKIPKGAKSYTLFLMCNAHWMGTDKAADFENLENQFSGFGDVIGDDNFAVWFWKKKVTQGTASDVDVSRSISFCRRWGLNPSEGPFIVVTTHYPDESSSNSLPEGTAVFSLSKMTMPNVIALLDQLGDELLKYDKVQIQSQQKPEPKKEPKSQQVAVLQQPFWIRLLYAVQISYGGFGCTLSFEVSSGPVKTKWEPCKGPDKP